MGKIKNVNLIAILAIVLVAFMTVGYAYVSDNEENINSGSKKSWNVGFNTEDYTSAGVGNDGSGPVISKNNVKFDVDFSNPGDYKTYTFEYLNSGDINAVLENVKVISNENNSSDLTFNYTIYKGENIITSSIVSITSEQYNHLYRNYGKNTIEVTIMYNGPAITDAMEPVSASYELNLVYTQAE